MSGLTEATANGGWRIVETQINKPKPSRKIGINHEIVRRDIAHLFISARKSLYAGVLNENKRGLVLTFAASEAARISSLYKRKSSLSTSPERALATAEYWTFIANNIAKMKNFRS